MFTARNYAAISASAGNDQEIAQAACECINEGVAHFIQFCKSRGVPVAIDGRIKPVYEALAWALVQSSPWLKAVMERDGGLTIKPPRAAPRQRRTRRN